MQPVLLLNHIQVMVVVVASGQAFTFTTISRRISDT